MDRNIFRKKTIVVGVSGGIAAYKVIDIVVQLRKLGANVHVIMTHHATMMVDPKNFKKASGNEVQIPKAPRRTSSVFLCFANSRANSSIVSSIALIILLQPSTTRHRASSSASLPWLGRAAAD